VPSKVARISRPPVVVVHHWIPIELVPLWRRSRWRRQMALVIPGGAQRGHTHRRAILRIKMGPGSVHRPWGSILPITVQNGPAKRTILIEPLVVPRMEASRSIKPRRKAITVWLGKVGWGKIRGRIRRGRKR